MTQLAPCPHCHRHVEIRETACPFCAGALALADTPPRPLPGGRIGRAALFAFAAAAGCGDNDKPVLNHPPVDAGADAHKVIDAEPDAGPIAIYSAAPTDARGG